MIDKSYWPQAGVTRQNFLRMATVSLAALACGIRGASATTKPIKVGFIVPDYAELRWKNADQAFFEQAAAKLGFTALVQVSNDSESQQTSQVENLLTLGVDVLVLTPVNVNAATALVHKANLASVPVINYNFLIPKANVAAFVGRDAVEIGEKIATSAVTAKPKGNYILCFGDQGASVAVDTAKGNLNVLQPLVQSGAVKIVSQQYNKSWSTASARAQVENALTKNGNDIAAVLCSNDMMAYGAIQALQAQGLGGKVFVSGVDCEPRAQELLQQGLLSVSNFSAFDQMGMRAAQAAQQVATGAAVTAEGTVNNGLKDVPWIKGPNVNVTKSNLAETAAAYPWWFDKKKLGL